MVHVRNRFELDSAGLAVPFPDWSQALAVLHRRGLAAFILLPDRALVRRQLNLLLALAAVLLLGPLMLLIALAIKLVSGGPVVDRELRVGIDRRLPIEEPSRWRRSVDHGGRLFTLYRFRAPSEGRGARFGRLLRRYRLDGLPQIVNVIRGDMNLVGPRPYAPGEVSLNVRTSEPFRRRQRVLPGITGRGQLRHSSMAASPAAERWLRAGQEPTRELTADLEYIDRQSVAEDCRVLLRAVTALLGRRRGPGGAGPAPRAGPAGISASE